MSEYERKRKAEDLAKKLSGQKKFLRK